MHREMEHVLAALTPANRLVARVCIATGLRVGDVVKLRTETLAAQFWITESKTRKRKRVNLSKKLLADLRAQAGAVWVFRGAKSEDTHRTRQAVWSDVKRAAKAFRLKPNVAPHSWRKIYAVDMLKQSKGDLKKVQRALNHGDQATTMIYAMSCELYKAKYGDGKTE